MYVKPAFGSFSRHWSQSVCGWAAMYGWLTIKRAWFGAAVQGAYRCVIIDSSIIALQLNIGWKLLTRPGNWTTETASVVVSCRECFTRTHTGPTRRARDRQRMYAVSKFRMAFGRSLLFSPPTIGRGVLARKIVPLTSSTGCMGSKSITFPLTPALVMSFCAYMSRLTHFGSSTL